MREGWVLPPLLNVGVKSQSLSGAVWNSIRVDSNDIDLPMLVHPGNFVGRRHFGDPDIFGVCDIGAVRCYPALLDLVVSCVLAEMFLSGTGFCW